MGLSIYAPTGLTLYVLFRNHATGVAMTEDTSLDLGWYEANDAAIAAALLPAGIYTGTFREGTAASPSASDPDHGMFQGFRWNGSAEIDVLGRVNSGLELDGSVYRATANFLEQAPVAAGGPVSPFLVDNNHTWRFSNRSQTIAPNNVTDQVGFEGLLAMDFTYPMPAEDTIHTIQSATFTNVVGVTEPTVDSSAISASKKQVHLTVDAATATAGTHTCVVRILTVDGQVFERRGRLVLT